MKTEKFDVIGMTCSSCVAHVEKSVSKIVGVKSVNVNLLTNSMSVIYDELNLNNNVIEKSVEDAGYEAHVRETTSNTTASTPKVDFVKLEQEEMKMRWWVSLALSSFISHSRKCIDNCIYTVSADITHRFCQ